MGTVLATRPAFWFHSKIDWPVALAGLIQASRLNPELWPTSRRGLAGMWILAFPLKRNALPRTPSTKLTLFNAPLFSPVWSLASPSARHQPTTPSGFLEGIRENSHKPPTITNKTATTATAAAIQMIFLELPAGGGGADGRLTAGDFGTGA